MLIEHEGRRPWVHPDAYVAPTAVLSGGVRVRGLGRHRTDRIIEP